MCSSDLRADIHAVRYVDDEVRAAIKRVYETQCAGCHGEQGNGKGAAADMLIVKPRDFTKGLYKFRSTPNGTLPTDDDLYRTITKGVNRTSMPEWSLLPERERHAVVEYVKSFYPQWDERGALIGIGLIEKTLGVKIAFFDWMKLGANTSTSI